MNKETFVLVGVIDYPIEKETIQQPHVRAAACIEDAKASIKALFPELTEVTTPGCKDRSFEFRGNQAAVTEAATALAHVIDVETKKRLYELSIFELGKAINQRFSVNHRTLVPDTLLYNQERLAS